MDLRDFWLYSHAGCMDGSLAAILFMHAGGKKENIRWMNPGHVDEDLAESSGYRDPRIPILLVDVAPNSIETAENLSDRGNFTVIDHHATSERFTGIDGFEISVGNQACGGELFRRWLCTELGMEQFNSPAYRRFAALVDDHDRWRLQYPFSRQMARFFAFTGQQVFVERFMDVEGRFGTTEYQMLESDTYWTANEREMLGFVEQAQARRFKSLLKRFVVRKQQFQGREITVGYLISDEANSSELLNAWLVEHPEADLACQVNFHSGKLSYRGVGRVDIPALLKPFGGGGHFNAGGCAIPMGTAEQVVERVVGR